MPWCVRKCPYCDFNSHQLKNDLPEKIYIDTLIRDLQNDIPKVAGRTISSIFIGGGTPSLFSPEAIARLLKEIQQHIAFTPDIEITLEANPGTVDQDRFIGFRQAGVNRLSIGIQSFQAEKLKALGRIHDDHAALRAAQAARSAGFTRFNLDLMHGLPNQNIGEATADVETALGFSPPHLSWYQLTIEPNTLFHHRPPVLPDDTILGSIQEQGHDILLTSGYQHYEVSAYCLPDYECRHNLNYWQFGDYLGIGAGAHSKITDMQQHTCSRFWKLKNPQDYLKANNSFIGDENIISKKDLPFEFMRMLYACKKVFPHNCIRNERD